MKKVSVSRRIFQICNYLVLGGFALMCLLPFWHVLCASFSNPYYVMESKGVIWYIKDFTLEGYKIVLANKEIWRGYANTILYCILVVIIGMFITMTGAYVTSRKEFLLRNIVSLMTAITMLFGAGMIPSYLVVKSLGMYNTIWAVVIPGCFSVFNMIMLRAAFSQVPEPLVESAKLDGAGHFTILLKILMPLSKPTVVVLIVYAILGQWNSWFNASIYLRKTEWFPLQLILRQILLQHQGVVNAASNVSGLDYQLNLNIYDELVQYCTIIVAMVPVMCTFPFMQKYFTQGMKIGAIKE